MDVKSGVETFAMEQEADSVPSVLLIRKRASRVARRGVASLKS